MKKDKTLLILGAFVMFFGVGYFLYGVIGSWVMGDREAVYETYTVKRGDTFWGIMLLSSLCGEPTPCKAM